MDLETPDNVKVLLVDDDHDDYMIVKRNLARLKDSPFALDWVDSFDSGLEEIERDAHDVYLIDYMLGARTGLELLKIVEPENRRQPFILMTGAGSEEIEWRSIQLAASDYLVKGSFDTNLLSRTLYYALQRKRIEEQRVEHLLELNQSKDEFISIASHQLRTPATGVKQYVGMLLEGFAGPFSTQQSHLLKKAYESNERQLKIVSDLLKVAQVDAGKVMLHKRPLSMNWLVDAIVREQREILAARNQTLVYKPFEKDIVISIDEASVRMVLENIIDNASKYSHEHTQVTVSLTASATCVYVNISDEGVGIDPESEWRLFEKFSRLDNPLSTQVGGSGLGLYWARKIIDLHGGKIEYVANTGPGTTFHVSLPKKDKV